MTNEMKLYRWSAVYQLILALCISLTSCSDAVRQTSQKRFMQMVRDGEVERVTIIKGKLVEVFLTPEALTQTKYRGVTEQLEQGGPNFTVQIVSEQAFRNELVLSHATFPITTE